MPIVPIPLPERMATVGCFIASMILIVMVLGSVLQSFPENPLAMVLGLIIVLVATVAVVWIFVKLIF